MYLSSVHLTDFRCYESLTIDDLGRLAVFIGENDAGKTVILDSIEVLVGDRAVTQQDFRKASGTASAIKIVIKGTFNLTENDQLPEEFISEDQLILSRTFCLEPGGNIVQTISHYGRGYSDGQFDTFATLSASEQRQLLEAYGCAPGRNGEERTAQVSGLLEQGKLSLVPKEKELAASKANTLKTHLPHVERISSTEYQSPEIVVRRTFQNIAARAIAPINNETNQPQEIEELRKVRELIETSLNEEAQKMLPILKVGHHKLSGVYVRPVIEFSKAVSSTPIALDCGEGEQGFEAFGEGTKKRIWMALLNWERQTIDRLVTRNAIRLYDEPDVNLHYQAQRQLFENILQLADDDAETQCLVCTHSVQMIDRAPVQSVLLIRVDDDASRSLIRIQGLEDTNYTDFFSDVGQAVGLSNTAILFERAFIVVEGESEEASLPIIYRNLYGRSIWDDGIRMINLETCGAWRSVLKILLKNRLDVVHMLLDTDCTASGSSAQLRPDVLAEIGCATDFEARQVTYIGVKEYEDAFDAQLILDAIHAEFDMDTPLVLSEIEDLKRTSDKFSTDFKQMVFGKCKGPHKSKARKPAIAQAVARQCVNHSDVPAALTAAFTAVRQRAGITDAQRPADSP